MRVLPWILLAALGAAGSTAAGAQEQTVKVGIARSTSNAAELMALKHGYFKEAGIKLEWDDIDSTANVIALLAQNQYRSSRAASRLASSTRWRRTCRSPSCPTASRRRSATT